MPRPNFITELDVGDDPSDPTWAHVVDISSDVRHIEIKRGAPDELSQVEAATGDYTLSNLNGRFDPFNEGSDLYPYLRPEGMRIRTYVPRWGAQTASSSMTLSGNEQSETLRRDGRPGRFPVFEAAAETCDQTTLSGAMTNVQTTLPLTAWPKNPDGSSAWPMFSAFRVMVDQETMLITAGWGTTTPTVTRGVAQRWSTAQSAAAHSAGAVVSNFFEGWNVVNSKAYSLGGIPTDQVEVVRDPTRKGRRAWKITVAPGDANDATDLTRERLEFTKLALGELGERWCYGFSRKLPPGFHENNSGVGATIAQLGPNYNSGSPALVLRANFDQAGAGPHTLGDDYFRLVFNTGVSAGSFIGTFTEQHDLAYAEEAVWHDFIFVIFWHLSAGSIQVFHRIEDGPWKKVLDLSGIPTSTDFNGLGTPSVKLSSGLYRNADAVLTNSIYIDEHRAGGSVWDVLPDDVPIEDGNLGIWPGTTNLLSNETLTANGTPPTILNPDPAIAPPIPGSNVQRIDFLALNDYVHRTFSGLTIGVTYTASWWVLREEADANFVKFAVRNAANSADVGTANAAFHERWQRLTVTWTATETSGRIRLILTDSVNTRARIWATAPMLEASAYPTPYTPVGTPRSASRVQKPALELDETAGWLVTRVRLAIASSETTGDRYVWNWGDDSTHRLVLWWNDTSKQWQFGRGNGTVTSKAWPDSFLRGAERTIVCLWSSTQLKISVDGAPFTAVSQSAIPTLAATNFDLGSNAGANHLDGAVLWMASGSGVLTDADAAEIHRRYGFGDGAKPLPSDRHFDEAKPVETVWRGRDSTYLLPDHGYICAGFYDGGSQGWPDVGHNATLELHAEDGLQILAETPLPTSDPDVLEYQEVVGSRRPAFFWGLDDPPGTRTVIKPRRVATHAGGAHGIYIFHRRKKKITKSEAEGQSGPPGIYKNTPLLGEPGLIIGDAATSTRFRRAQNEFVLIPLEDDADAIPQGSITIEAWISPDSFASGVGNENAIFSGPETNFGAHDPAFRLKSNSAGVTAVFPDAGGFNPDPSVAHTLVAGSVYYVAVTVDDALNAIVVVGDVTNETFTVGTTTPLAAVGGLIAAAPKMRIAAAFVSSSLANHYFDGRIQNVAVYQRGLSLEALEANFESGAFRGFPEQTPAERIAGVLGLVGLWP